MEQLEKDILIWFFKTVENPKVRTHLLNRLNDLTVIEREFTGGGVIVCFDISDIENREESVRFEGPLLTSSELEAGASCDIGAYKNGRVDYIEIFSKSGCYPIDRHPLVYALTEPPPVNYISTIEE